MADHRVAQEKLAADGKRPPVDPDSRVISTMHGGYQDPDHLSHWVRAVGKRSGVK